MSPSPQPAALRCPLVYAHRGGAALRPENTIEAFDYGLSVGAHGLEFDVQLSRDGIVVVHHDLTLERTTNGRGRVADHTADEMARLDAGHWFSPTPFPASSTASQEYPYRGRAGGVPTLRTVLQRYREAQMIIELKANDTALAQRAIDDIRSADAVDRVALGSFWWRVLNAARTYEPAIRTGACREETRWALYTSWVGWPLRHPSYSEFQVPERSGRTTIVTPRFIARAHRAEIPVKVWTVNDEPDMRRLLSWGVDAIISDRPEVAVRVLLGSAGF